MPKRAPLSTTCSSIWASALCGPSIGTFNSSRSSAAPPIWSIWPCVSQIFSTVTPDCLIASRIFGTSPPGSITTAFLLGSCQRMVQFCSNSVTGTMIAPALALVSVCWVIQVSPLIGECGGAADPDQGMAGRFSYFSLPLRRDLNLIYGLALPRAIGFGTQSGSMDQIGTDC